VNYGAGVGTNCAFGESEVPYPTNGREGELFVGETCDFMGLEEEVSKVAIFWVKGQNRGDGKGEVLHKKEKGGQTRLSHGGGTLGHEA